MKGFAAYRMRHMHNKCCSVYKAKLLEILSRHLIGMFKVREIEKTQHDIWRVFISGSSGSGKTHFAEQLLKRKFFKFERIYYYHPDLQESFPTNW